MTNAPVQARITKEGDLFVLVSPYNGNLVQACRDIPGRHWTGGRRVWTFPVDAVTLVLEMAKQFDISMAEDVLAVPAQEQVVEHQWGVEQYKEGRLILRFSYSQTIIGELKRVFPNYRYLSKQGGWSVDDQYLGLAINFAAKHHLEVEPSLEAEYARQQVVAQEMHEASMATDADLEVEGLAEGMELLPYQRAGINYLRKARRAILADEVGLGKTVQALVSIVQDKQFPAVLITPNSLKLNWQREIKKWYPQFTGEVMSGTRSQPLLPTAQFYIANYDIVNARADTLIGLNPQALVCDEAHMLKNGKPRYYCKACDGEVVHDARHCPWCTLGGDEFERYEKWTVQRTNGVMRLARAIPDSGMILMVTGTPVMNRPVELLPLLTATTHLEQFGSRNKFTRRYCGTGGKGATNMAELNRRLRETCMVRRVKKDVIKELPELRIATEWLVIDKAKMQEYYKVEDDVVEYLALKAAEYAKQAGDTPQEAYWHKKMRAAAAEHLVRISVLKGKIAEIKREAVIEWIANFMDMDDEQKLLAFAERIETVESLYDVFGTDMAVKIRGGVSKTARMEAVDKFQNDPNYRLFMANIAAASTGYTLTAASNIAVIEEPWSPATLEQIAGRSYARANDIHGVTVWHLLVPNTIDEEIFKLLASKEQVVNAVMDGKDAQQTSVLGDLLISLAQRGLSRR